MIRLLRVLAAASVVGGVGFAVLPSSEAGATTSFTTFVSSSAFNYSEGLAVNPAGNLFVASYYSGNVLEETARGLVTVASVPGNAKGVVFDASGDLFISVQGPGTIYEESAAVVASGIDARPFAGLTLVATLPTTGVGGLAFDPAGDLFIADTSGVAAVAASALSQPGRFPLSTGNGLLDVANSTTGVPFASDVTFDPQGDLFVTDPTLSKVVGFSAPAVRAALLGTPISSSSQRVIANGGSSGLTDPVGIVADGAGNLVIADDGTGVVYELSAISALTALAHGIPVNPSALAPLTTIPLLGMELGGLAIDPAGRLFVGDGGNNDVRVSTAAFLTPTTSVPGPPLNVTVTGTSSSLSATWTASASPQSAFECTLLYGFGSPTTFHQVTTGNSCTFAGLAPNTDYGVSVVVETASGPSVPAVVYSLTDAPSTGRGSVICVRGTVTRRVFGRHPTCPRGFHRR